MQAALVDWQINRPAQELWEAGVGRLTARSRRASSPQREIVFAKFGEILPFAKGPHSGPKDTSACLTRNATP